MNLGRECEDVVRNRERSGKVQGETGRTGGVRGNEGGKEWDSFATVLRWRFGVGTRIRHVMLMARALRRGHSAAAGRVIARCQGE